MECIAPVAVCAWQQGKTQGRHRPAKPALAAKRACGLGTSEVRTFKEKIFRARPALNICRAWRRWRCGYDKCANGELANMESHGPDGTAAVRGVWRNGDGPVALPQAHSGAAAAGCPGLGRGGEAAIAAGPRVLPGAGHGVPDEEL